MCDISKLFYTVDGNEIEGYLDKENKKSEILFVLKEPHAKKESVKGFWLRDDVLPYPTKATNNYYIAFRALAKLLLGDANNDDLLHSCAFINIFPFHGEGRTLDNCKIVISQLSDAQALPIPIDDKSEFYPEIIASNRKYLIENINSRYVVTTCDIFDALITGDRFNGIEYKYIFKEKQVERSFKAAKLNDNKIIIAAYHPAFVFPYRNPCIAKSEDLKERIKTL